MSEDERTDEETSEELVDEETETAADDAGEDDAFLAGEVEIPQGGGCSAGTWVIILLIIAALIYVGVWQVQKRAAETAANEAAQRQAVRQTQLADIAGDITTVETGLQQGDIAGAIETLKQMDNKLGIVQTAANQSGDTDAASTILSMRKTVETAVADIEKEYASLQDTADKSMGAVRAAMGSLAPAATPVTEPAGETADATANQPAADTQVTPEAAEAPDVVPAPEDVAPAPEDVVPAPAPEDVVPAPAPEDVVPVPAPEDVVPAPADNAGVPAGEPAQPDANLAPAG